MASALAFDHENCQLEQVIDALHRHRVTIQRLDLHRFLTDDSLHEILAFFHSHSAVCHIRALNVASNPCITNVSILRLADNIQANTLSLRELDLSNNPKAFTTESLDALVGALSASSIERLCLSSNALHKRDKALERLIRNNRTVQHLILSNNHLGARHIQTLASALDQNQSIKQLDVSNNPLKDAGIKRLMTSSICQSLTSVNLSLTQCGSQGANYVKNCLLRNRSIQRIDLSKNVLSNEGADSFGTLLRHNYTLRELNLSQNNIGNKGMEAIVQGLIASVETRLTHLDVSSNGLTDAEIIGELIRKSLLVDLCLRDNAIIDMIPLANAVHVDVSLKILDVSKNKMIDPSCWMDLMYHGAYSLDHFLYDENHLDEVQAERLEAAIRFLNNENTWLARKLHQIETRPNISLDLTGYRYGDEEIIRIAQALERHRPTVTKVAFSSVHDRGFCFFGCRVFRNWTVSLVRFHLHDCQHLGGEGWNELTRAIADQRCPLETLSLVRCRLRQPIKLALAIDQNLSLKRLCLEANDLDTVEAKAILSAALQHPTLGYLDLANNNLTDDVLTGMPPIERLRTLKLHNNQITDVGALSIAQAIMHCNSMCWLTLKGNKLTKKGVKALTIFLKLPQVLDLDCDD